MKLNLGKQIITVENRNLDSIIEQCLEQKIKEKIVEVAKREFFELDNKSLSKVFDSVKDSISVNGIMSGFENLICETLEKTQY